MKKYSFMLEKEYQKLFETARASQTEIINTNQKYQIDKASASQTIKYLLDFWHVKNK